MLLRPSGNLARSANSRFCNKEGYSISLPLASSNQSSEERHPALRFFRGARHQLQGHVGAVVRAEPNVHIPTLTRARISQLPDLTLLAPAVQEAVLELEAVDGREPLTERRLRGVLRAGDWRAQGEAWIELGEGLRHLGLEEHRLRAEQRLPLQTNRFPHQ